MYVYDSQIVHPTPPSPPPRQCFKSFYPVYFVNYSQSNG